MWPTRLVLATLAASLLLTPSVHAVESSPVEMWECPGPEGTILYTNKERPDCQAKVLKALSVGVEDRSLWALSLIHISPHLVSNCGNTLVLVSNFCTR